MSSIEIEDLVKKHGAVTAVDRLSLRVETGRLVTLLGPSGCGKTTTLRCIAGLETPDHGLIRIGTKTVTSMAENILLPPEKREIGMVFQSYALWPH